MASVSLMAALGGKSTTTLTTAEDQFKLPDLVSSEVKEQTSCLEQELLKPLPKPAIKPHKYFRTHFSNEQIKLGATLQREQQKQRVEDALQQQGEIELTQEEMDEMMRKEQAKQEWVQRYARCMKEKEEQREDKADNEEQQKEGEMGETGEVITEKTESKKLRELRPRNPHRSKKKEVAQEEAEEEEEEYERMEEATRKRKVIGCINPQEAVEFQNFIKGKMEELVDEMKAEKDIINPV